MAGKGVVQYYYQLKYRTIISMINQHFLSLCEALDHGKTSGKSEISDSARMGAARLSEIR